MNDVTYMKHWITKLGLFSVWDKFPIAITHTHTHSDDKHRKILDHWLCNKRLLENIEDAGILDLIDNTSDHVPIMLKLKVDNIFARNKPNVSIPPKRPAWYKASETEKNGFTELVLGLSIGLFNCYRCFTIF